MKIVDYILAKIAPRLRQKRLLVIYDPAGRFKSLAETLANSHQALFLNATTHLLDALKSTHQAIQSGLKQAIVIYLTYPAPQTIEAKVADPLLLLQKLEHDSLLHPLMNTNSSAYRHFLRKKLQFEICLLIAIR